MSRCLSLFKQRAAASRALQTIQRGSTTRGIDRAVPRDPDSSDGAAAGLVLADWRPDATAGRCTTRVSRLVEIASLSGQHGMFPVPGATPVGYALGQNSGEIRHNADI